MAKSINGDPIIDAQVEDWIKLTKKLFTPKTFRNMGLPTLKKLIGVASHIFGQSLVWSTTRIQQSIGGGKNQK